MSTGGRNESEVMREPNLFFTWIVNAGLLVVLSLVVSSCLEFKNEKQLSQADIQASFASLNRSLFVPKCLSCHSGPNSPHGVDVSSYNSIVNSPMFPPLIIPGNPEKSSLYQACASGVMPKGAPHLPDAYMQALYQWIKNGAKENEDDPNPTPSVTPSPTEPGSDYNEPCDPSRVRNEPGYDECSNEPHD